MCAWAARSSASASSPDRDRVIRTEKSHQLQKISHRSRNASLRGALVRPRDMQEDRASCTRHDGRVVEAEHDDEIVEMVLAPECFRAGAIWQFDGPVVS